VSIEHINFTTKYP